MSVELKHTCGSCRWCADSWTDILGALHLRCTWAESGKRKLPFWVRAYGKMERVESMDMECKAWEVKS